MGVIGLFGFYGGDGFVVAGFGQPFDGVLLGAFAIGKQCVVILRAEFYKAFKYVCEEFPFCRADIHQAQETQKPDVFGFFGEQLPARGFDEHVIDVADLAYLGFACVEIGVVIDIRAHRRVARNRLGYYVEKLRNGDPPRDADPAGCRVLYNNIVIALLQDIHYGCKGRLGLVRKINGFGRRGCDARHTEPNAEPKGEWPPFCSRLRRCCIAAPPRGKEPGWCGYSTRRAAR